VRILLVEDEPDAARLIAKGLREEAYAVDVAGDAETASFQASIVDYDAIVLDVMIPAHAHPAGVATLPSPRGLAVCRHLRQGGSHVPILMLTAQDSVSARIDGLDAGADDYLIKPFAFGELLARLRALIRRGLRAPLPDALDVGGLHVDTRARHVLRDGRELPLTNREYALFEFLARRAGQVVSRAEIAEHVWDDHYDPLSNVIDVYIQRLRRKIDRPGAESLIRTRRGEGYQLAG
jgi:two-component system copper resistance phosphate regulon response regulator CusR